MKNKKLLLLFFCAIPVAALRWGGHLVSGDQAASGIAFFMPQLSTDFGDLDSRDSHGNKVINPAAGEELETLFRENIVNLTVFATPRTMNQILNWLETFSHLFNSLFLTRLPNALRQVFDVFFRPFKRFVHNVHNLCITFSVGLFAGAVLLAASILQRSPRLVPIRC